MGFIDPNKPYFTQRLVQIRNNPWSREMTIKDWVKLADMEKELCTLKFKLAAHLAQSEIRSKP